MLLNREDTIYLSHISTLEIGLKFRIEKMKLLSSPVECISSRLQLFGFSCVYLEDEAILKLCDLPRHRGAPFDGLMMHSNDAQYFHTWKRRSLQTAPSRSYPVMTITNGNCLKRRQKTGSGHHLDLTCRFGSLASVLTENFFAETQVVWRRLHVLILTDEFDGFFETQEHGRF